nr:alpha/beta fold hydrolase [Paenibacillus wynnii]
MDRGNDQAVLFLHFSGGNLNMWDGIIPQFEKNYSIVAPDFRGHGKSDKPESGYHIVRVPYTMSLEKMGYSRIYCSWKTVALLTVI